MGELHGQEQKDLEMEIASLKREAIRLNNGETP
jgi:hypothetical protein